MIDTPAPQAGPLVTGSEIARLAGVTRAASRTGGGVTKTSPRRAAAVPTVHPRRCGQESDARSAVFAQLRADLTGHTGAGIVSGDSLRDDQWTNLKAELVVCDPPVSESDWGREDLLLDPRWAFGTPSRAEGELAWLQHAYAHTAPGGRVLVVLPASVAYRKAGRRIRAELVRRGVLTHIIALPSGTAASHALPVHLWQLRRPSAEGRRAEPGRGDPGEGRSRQRRARPGGLTGSVISPARSRRCDYGTNELPEPLHITANASRARMHATNSRHRSRRP